MANTIKLKRKIDADGAPTTGDLVAGELAINAFSGRLFLEKSDGGAAVVEMIHDQGGQTINGSLTVGTFTSTGIDDNATVEQLQIADAAITFGTATSEPFTLRMADQLQYIGLSGGATSGTGGNIRLYGNAATNANDILLRTDTTNVGMWDNSAGTWEFDAGTTPTLNLTLSGNAGSELATFAGDVTITGGNITVNNVPSGTAIAFVGTGNGRLSCGVSGDVSLLNAVNATAAGAEMRFRVDDSGGTIQTVLTLDESQNATFTANADIGTEILFTERAAHVFTPVATRGILWVRSDTPNVLVFTDDAGTDWDLNTAAGGTIGGSITDNQIAVGATTADDIEGSANFTWDGTSLIVNNSFNNFTLDGSLAATLTPMAFNGSGTTTGRYVDIIVNDNLLTTGSLLRLDGNSTAHTGPLLDLNRVAGSGPGIGITPNTASKGVVFTGGTDSGNAFEATFGVGNNGIGLSSTHNLATDLGMFTNASIQLGGDIVFNEKADHSVVSPAVGFGYLWVRSDGPNILVFTDDAGTDWDLNTAPVIDGSGSATRVTFWTDGDTITSSSNFSFDTDSITTTQFDLVANSALTSGDLMHVVSNLSTKTADMVNFHQQHASSAANALHVEQAGTGVGLYVQDTGTAAAGSALADINANNTNRTGNVVAIRQDHASSSADALSVIQDGAGEAINVTNSHAGGLAARFYSNVATRTVPIVSIINDNATGAGSVLRLQNDQSGDLVAMFDGATEAFTINGEGKIDRYGGAATSTDMHALLSDGTDMELRAIVEADISDLQAYLLSADVIFTTDADDNIIGGDGAGAGLASGGIENFLAGQDAGSAVTTGDYNVAIGFQALHDATAALTGSDNIAIGRSAMSSSAMTAATDNIAIGEGTLTAITSGTTQIAIGQGAMAAMQTGSGSIAIGQGSLAAATGTRNTAVGHLAGGRVDTGTNNSFLGQLAGRGVTSGNHNVGIGNSALGRFDASATGDQNVAIGYQAMYDAAASITSAANNVAIGFDTLAAITTGTDNVAIGQSAGNAVTDGFDNTMVGDNAGLLISTGDNNVCYGTGAGNTLTTGNANLCIGYLAGPTTNQSNRLYINNSQSDTPLIGGDFATGEVQFNGTVRFTERADHIATFPAATFGELWVRSDAPNVLVFTDDAGTDWDLNTAGVSPGGSEGHFQFNQASAFAGDSTLATDGSAILTTDQSFEILTGDLLMHEKADHTIGTIGGGDGLLWVRSDTPNVLVFTDDAGTDWDLNTAAGGGDVTKVGTPVDNEIGVWTGDGTLEGEANFLYDDDVTTGAQLSLSADSGLTSGSTFDITSNVSTHTGTVLALSQAHTDGTADTLNVHQEGDAHAITVTHAETNGNLLRLVADVVGRVEPIIDIIQDNVSNTGGALIRGQQDGTADMIQLFDGATEAFTINDEGKIDRYGGSATSTDRMGILSDGTDMELRLLVEADISDFGTYGDVFKVGTPVDNEIGVWTGDGTIEGEPLFTLNNTAITGNMASLSANAALTSGDVLQISSNLSTKTTRVVHILQDHASSTADALFVQQDGTGDGVSAQSLSATGRAGYFYTNVASRTNPLVEILNDNATGTGETLVVGNDSTGNILQLNSDGAEVLAVAAGRTTGNMIEMVPNAELTSGRILDVRSNISTKTGYLAAIDNDHASSIAGGLFIGLQGGSGYGLAIDSDSSGRNLDISGTGGGDGIYVRLTNVAGEHIHLHNDVANRTEDAMLRVEQFNTTDPNAVKIVHITTRGVGDALYVGSIEKVDNKAAHFYSSTASRTEPVALIHNDNATGSGVALEVRQDQGGAAIVVNGGTVGEYVIGRTEFTIPAVTQDNWVDLGELQTGSYTVRIATTGFALYNAASFHVTVEFDSVAEANGSHDGVFVTSLEKQAGFTELEGILAEWVSDDSANLWLQLQGTASGAGTYVVTIEGNSYNASGYVADGTVTQTDPTLDTIVPSMTIDDSRTVPVTAFSGDVDPTVTNTQDLGQSGLIWANVWATTFNGTATTAQYADLAENYAPDIVYGEGTVLMFGGTMEVTEATPGTTAIAGIVSTNPAFLMNEGLDGVSVALRGRVPCKVYGPISKGDLMVAGSGGVAVADNNANPNAVVGRAIADNEDGYAIIEVVVA